MRCVQLTDHFVHDVEKLLPVTNILDQRLILRSRAVPVLAVHTGVVEAILHRAPRIVEHFGPLGRLVDLDSRCKAYAPPSPSYRPVVSRAETRAPRRWSDRARVD